VFLLPSVFPLIEWYHKTVMRKNVPDPFVLKSDLLGLFGMAAQYVTSKGDCKLPPLPLAIRSG
jgi:hypothetical protein